ncbi:MAG: hypothetical protein JNM57_10900 [Cyclobacteriaceae bacterium]|nr:hypothetical protein [Cyclobacteriaceae bacterium]
MTLQQLEHHVTSFLHRMNERGYNGHFLCNASYPGKLKESLTRHLLDILKDEPSIPPFGLTTYSHWRDEQSPRVVCDLKVKYSNNEGFQVDTMDITSSTGTGKLKSVTLPIKSNIDMPYCEQANRMVLDRDKTPKLKRP